LEILELIGRGGMGVVYKARQKRLDRLVALKILSPKIGQDPAFAARFQREARAMAMLSHPNIVAVYDFGQTASPTGKQATDEGLRESATPSGGSKDEDNCSEAGLYYFLMEFVDGVNVRQLLDSGRLAPEEALAIVPQICEALQYAHDHGVVHRDIKPENVLLDKEGRVKIADFGIAKLVARDAKDLTLTGAGQIVGTPQYMAPEQIEHPLQVDHRADIYSLGVVFYQMLTGELPIGRFVPPSKKVHIDVRLDEVVLRALEKEPEQRYQQASEIKTRVETIVTTASAEESNPARAQHSANAAQLQVNSPALGLVVTSVLNWSAIFVLVLAVLPVAAQKGVSPDLFLLVAAILAFGSAFILLGALKMQRLESLALARLAAVAAMLIGPGYIIGWPVGIWSLVVLSRPEVVAAFRENERLPQKGARRWVKKALWSVVVIVVIAVVIRTFALENFRVTSDAVAPDVPQGSYAVVFKLVQRYYPGDIAAYRANGLNELGRVIEEGPRGGQLLVQRRRESPREIPAADLIGKVILNTRAERGAAKPADTRELKDIRPLDVLQIRAINVFPGQPIDGYYCVELNGNVALGPLYGRANIGGQTMEQAEATIVQKLKETCQDPAVQVSLAIRPTKWRRAVFRKLPFAITPYDVLMVRVANALPDQPIDNYYVVEAGGTIALGPAYGRVRVAGLSLEEAEEAIKTGLAALISEPHVIVTLQIACQSSDTSDVQWQEVAMPTAPSAIQRGELLFINVSGTLPTEPIEGIYVVEPTGTISLGLTYGRAKVEGLMLEGAEKAISEKLHAFLRDPQVSVTLAGWTNPCDPGIVPGPQAATQPPSSISPSRKVWLQPKPRDAGSMAKPEENATKPQPAPSHDSAKASVKARSPVK
jgi:protein involved in polysaccharide export with SLBB domain